MYIVLELLYVRQIWQLVVIIHLHVLVYQGSSVSTQDGEVAAKDRNPGQEEGPLIQSDHN